MALEVTGIDHLYISVRDLRASEKFYDPVMQALGFRKSTRDIAGEPHGGYSARSRGHASHAGCGYSARSRGMRVTPAAGARADCRVLGTR